MAYHGKPINEVNGGTNQTTYTTGDLLYASGTNTLSKLAVGSSNKVLTVSGGLPTWQTASGGPVLLSNQTASSSSTIDFTSFVSASYKSYTIFIRNPVPSAALTTMQMLFSTDNGSTWLNSAYKWNQGFYVSSLTAPLGNASNSDSSIQLYDALQTNAGFTFNLDLTFYNVNTTTPITFVGDGVANDVVNALCTHSINSGCNTGTTAVNAIRLQPGSGNFATGTFKLFGNPET